MMGIEFVLVAGVVGAVASAVGSVVAAFLGVKRREREKKEAEEKKAREHPATPTS